MKKQFFQEDNSHSSGIVSYFQFVHLTIMIEINETFQRALDFVQYTQCSIFLTGKAGTGKTTFLQHCKTSGFKNMAVVAPTGVAAINAGGATIHSFFQLPFSPYLPSIDKFISPQDNVHDKNSLLARLKLSSERKEVMQQLELLIIDEASMVRCDILDAIDTILKYVRNNYQQPFGGVQLLLIGDLYQLPPVVKEEEWALLSKYYQNPFFFGSQVLKSNPPIYLALDKVYRQKDTDFISLLNKIRNNRIDDITLEQLNERYDSKFYPNEEDGYITLTTHNYKADAINERELNNLPKPEATFDALIEGEFSEKSYPADTTLRLKEGAQVMFIKNDTEKTKRYYNGKIGVVNKIEEDTITIACRNDDLTIEVKKETWKNIRYGINKQSNKIEEEEIGSFTQFPLRLAWAITIHKSQGLTFDKAIIDAGDAFAAGQVYVALSRCTGISGVVLKSKIRAQSIINDARIDAFELTQQTPEQEIKLLSLQKKFYLQKQILQLFNINELKNLSDTLLTIIKDHLKSFNDESLTTIEQINVILSSLASTSEKFDRQLMEYFSNEEMNEPKLQERIKAACIYFAEEGKRLQLIIQKHNIETDSKTIAAEFSGQINQLYKGTVFKIHLWSTLQDGFEIEKYHQCKKSFTRPTIRLNVYSGSKSDTDNNQTDSELLSKLRKKRDELCNLNQLPVYMVAGSNSLKEMCEYLPQTIKELQLISGFGKIKSRQFGEGFLEIIREYCDDYGIESKMEEKKISSRKEKKNKNVEGVSKTKKTDSKKLSYELFKEGKTTEEIALVRKLSSSTIEGHLAHFVKTGEIMVEELVATDRIIKIQAAIQKVGLERLASIKEELPSEISYGDIKMVVAAKNSIPT